MIDHERFYIAYKHLISVIHQNRKHVQYNLLLNKKKNIKKIRACDGKVCYGYGISSRSSSSLLPPLYKSAHYCGFGETGIRYEGFLCTQRFRGL